jgi:hypothetical protein
VSALTPDEAAGRRVDAKIARINERLARRYSDNSTTAQRNLTDRANFLRSQALSVRSVGGRSASHAR